MNKYSGFWVLGLLWLLATTLNFSKAVHIDDTFHLEAAQWIADNPIRPMSACINWGDDIQDMYCSSQPALYFYLLAITGSLSGWSIHALHGMQSIFTLLALCFFFFTARNIAPRFANWLTIILGTNAAFLVNQNLMVDMPILAMGMMVLYFSLKPNPRSGDFAIANIAIGLSFLMKYTSITFAPIIALSIILRRKWWMVVWVAIPGILFLLWSALNYHEYHRIHLINRVPEPFDIEVFKQKMISFVMVLGGISPFIITFFFRWVKGSAKMVWIAISVLLILIIFFVLGFYFEYFSHHIAKLFLLNIFMVSGICLILLSVWLFVSRIFIRHSDGYSLSTANMLILFLSFISMTVFVIWFAPFMATRHG